MATHCGTAPTVYAKQVKYGVEAVHYYKGSKYSKGSMTGMGSVRIEVFTKLKE
jgi:hypothetical protein